jgi:hypothetical protein
MNDTQLNIGVQEISYVHYWKVFWYNKLDGAG